MSYDAVRDAAHALGRPWFYAEQVLQHLQLRAYDTSIDQVAGMLNQMYRRDGELERRNEAGPRRRAMWRFPDTA